MNRKIFIILLLLLIPFVVLESTFTMFPFVLILSIMLFLLNSSTGTLLYIFFSSFALDSLKLEGLGITAIVIFTTLFVIDLYKRNFEVTDFKFVIFMTLISSLFYTKLAGYSLGIIYYLLFIVFILALAIRYIRVKKQIW